MDPVSQGVVGGLLAQAGALRLQHAEYLTRARVDAQEIEVQRVVAKPGFANLLLWRGLVDVGAQLHVVVVRIAPGTEPMLWPGGSVAKRRATEAPAGTRLRHALERFEQFSASWLFVHEAPEPDDACFLGVFRYAIDPASRRPLWGIRFDPSRPDRGVLFERLARVGRAEREAFFAALPGHDPDGGPADVGSPARA